MVDAQRSNIEAQMNLLIQSTKKLADYNLNLFGTQLLSILLGFFISTALSTIPAQTGDWGIVAAAIIVTNQEIISKITYQKNISNYYKNSVFTSSLFKYCNNVKIGILYGLFVDAFKLGS